MEPKIYIKTHLIKCMILKMFCNKTKTTVASDPDLQQPSLQSPSQNSALMQSTTLKPTSQLVKGMYINCCQ